MKYATLADVLREMDVSELFERNEGRLPFLLPDVHSSRTEFEFIECTNDHTHEWFTCIGTLHGTSLWQVGGSSEKNGSFNMEMSRGKANMLQLKHELSIEKKLVPADAIMLIK